MKKVFVIMFVIMIAFCVIGCSNLKDLSQNYIVDKTYVYEKDGCGGDFTIEIKADGTFTYYEGMLSSHIGMGEWTYKYGMLTLIEKSFQFIEAHEKMEEVISSYSFSVKKDTLIFVDENSSNFRYVKVANKEKFHVQ